MNSERSFAATGAPDTIVIGAGVVGVAAALALQARGAHVRIVDAQPPAQGCSYGNAGVIAVSSLPLSAGTPPAALPSLFLRRDSPATLHWPSVPALLGWGLHYVRACAPARVADSARTMHALALRAADAWRALLPPNPRYLRFDSGYLHLHLTAQEHDAANRFVAWRRELGASVDVLEPDDVARIEPALRGVGAGAALVHGAAHVSDPHGFVNEAFRVFIDRGGAYERDRIERIARAADGGVLLEGANGTRRVAPCVVLATGSRTNELLRTVGHRIPLVAERGYHVDLADGAPAVTRPVALPSVGVVLAQTERGYRLAGLSHFGRPGFTPRPSLMTATVAHLAALMPVAVRPGATIWTGERPATPDSLPVVERVPTLPSLIVCSGHGHLGLTLSAVTGGIVADLACGTDAPDAAALGSARFR